MIKLTAHILRRMIHVTSKNYKKFDRKVFEIYFSLKSKVIMYYACALIKDVADFPVLHVILTFMYLRNLKTKDFQVQLL